MILHIADDEKFIDHVINTFETVSPSNNIYLINSNSEPLHYIKSIHKNIIILGSDTHEYKQVIKDEYSFSAVIFHNLINPYKWKIIETLSPKLKIHWMSWGADLYSIPPFRTKIYQKDTKRYINSKLSLNAGVKLKAENLSPFFYNKLNLIIKGEPSQYFKFKSLVKKVNSVSTVIPNESSLIKKHLNAKIRFFPFKYVSLENLIAGVSDSICNKENVLLGNSAYPSNNHIEALNVLKTLTVNNKKIYVPVSYGNKEYAEKIIKLGESLFNGQFIPLREFLPISEYNKILLNCGNVIMNNNRQQALGNILLALRMGAKVYLNSKNLTASYFNQLGIKFFDIKTIKQTFCKSHFNDLALHNRPIIDILYGEERVYKETDRLVHFLKNK